MGASNDYYIRFAQPNYVKFHDGKCRTKYTPDEFKNVLKSATEDFNKAVVIGDQHSLSC